MIANQSVVANCAINLRGCFRFALDLKTCFLWGVAASFVCCIVDRDNAGKIIGMRGGRNAG